MKHAMYVIVTVVCWSI